MSIFQLNTIRKRLTFWLLLLAIIPIIITLISTYLQRVNEIENDTYDKLSTIRNLKVQQLNTWLDQRLNELNFISESMELRGLENIDFNNLTKEEGKKILDAKTMLIRDMKNFHDFSEISFLNSKTGIIELSTKSELIGFNESKNKYFTEPLQTGETYIKDIHHSKLTGHVEMNLSNPVYCLSHNQHVIGILVVRVNLSESLYPLLNNRVGLGKTGETLIVSKEGIALNELRWHYDAPLKLKIEAAPAVNAIKGKTGVIEDLDYRQELVLAAYTHIPQTGWGFVCKQDMHELRLPIRKMLLNFAIVFVLIALFSFILAWYIGKSIAKPIVAINNMAQRLGSGDISIRNSKIGNDELGELALELNRMADFTESKIIVQQGVTLISDVIIQQKSLLNFSKTVLRILSEITGASTAIFYILDEEHEQFKHFASIGASKEALESFSSEFPEGEMGIAVDKKEIIYNQNIAIPSKFNFQTSVGKITPSELITIPILADIQVVAIISLVSLNTFNKYSIDILNSSWLSINTAYSSLLSNERTAILAENLTRMYTQLEIQSEELQTRTEELYDQNIELENQKRRVEEANRLKSEFLSNMSHELRTPLNSINALTNVLIKQSSSRLDAEEKEYLQIVEKNGKNLLELINEILDLSKIEAGKLEIMPETIAVSTLLTLISDVINPLLDKKKVKFILDIKGELPTIESDEKRLYQILLNITNNAIKFTEEGEVKVEAKKVGNNIEIIISDTGIGIPEKTLPFIFDEFRQADGSASRNYEGTGLGLSIAKKLLNLIGGKVYVKSKEGIGTVFTLLIPIEWHSATDQITYKQLPKEPEENENNTILIIEDDISTALTISECLKNEGFNTKISNTGKEALNIIEKQSFYAITLDVFMPDIDGWEILQKIKENPKTKKVPVIIVSISTDQATGFALGAVGYVQKPIDENKLSDQIHNLNKAPSNILIVDDNDMDLNAVSSVFSNQNITLRLAKNGKECIKQIKEQIPDILILDLLMPEMDGFEVLHKIRKTEATYYLPVIIITAKDLTKSELELLNGQASAILSKSGATIETLKSEILNSIKKLETPYFNESKTFGKQRLTILVVEDNKDNMTIFKAILKDEFTILEATDGEKGLNMALSNLPDLILLDISLPILNGLQVFEKLKEHEKAKGIPVIAVTAHAMEEHKIQYEKAGFDDFVPKPINEHELKRKIKTLLNSSANKFKKSNT